MDVIFTWAESVGAQNAVTNVQRSTGASSNSLNMLETLFAGLSVLVGSLALVIGLLQLLKCQRRRRTSRRSSIHELEAILPEVIIAPLVDLPSSLIRGQIWVHERYQISEERERFAASR